MRSEMPRSPRSGASNWSILAAPPISPRHQFVESNSYYSSLPASTVVKRLWWTAQVPYRKSKSCRPLNSVSVMAATPSLIGSAPDGACCTVATGSDNSRASEMANPIDVPGRCCYELWMTAEPSAGIVVRPAAAEEVPSLIATAERAFGEDVRPDQLARDIASLPPERTLAAFDGAELVASTAIYTFDMTVPGGPSPVAGVTMVGVLPTHRRRGLLSALMRRQLTDLHETGGEPVAALWASEPAIYRRYGYGRASMRLSLTLQSHLPYVAGAPVAGPVRMVDASAAREQITAIYDRVRRTRPGMTSRTNPRWDSVFDDTEAARDGAGSLTCVLLDSGDGYLLYRTKGDWHQWIPNGKAVVRELIASDAVGHATLWRYLLDLDLMATVVAWNRPVDDPVQFLVTDFRRLHPAVNDALWVRIIDVERALAARTYGVADALVIDLVDEICPWNAGRFLLDVDAPGSGGVAVTRTDRPADLSLSAVELGAIYLGGTRVPSLAAAGFVDEHTAGALARADRLFASASEPWCAEVF